MIAFDYRAARFEYKFTETGTETKGSFEGYGSVFNEEDDGGDLMLPGAFKQTLLDHESAGTMPKMLLNHGGIMGWMSSPGPDDLLPVGKWSAMFEDAHGLQCKGRLINLDTESGKRIYGAMKEKALDGLSIGYQAKQFVRGTRANEPARTLKEVRLIEVSPVTFPMNGSARIGSVKSIDFNDLKGAEDLLREAAGFTRAQATGFLARIKRFQQQGEPAGGDEMKQLIAALGRRTELLRA
jgi:HK97 family phage prohead protease